MASTTTSALQQASPPSPPLFKPRLLPTNQKLLIGYGVNVGNVRKAVHDGVNVVIWAFMNIVATNDEDDHDEFSVGSSTAHRELQEIEGQQQREQERNHNRRTKARIKTSLDLEEIRQLIQELDEAGYSHVIHLCSFGGWNGPHLDPNLSAQEWYYDGWKQSIASQIFHGIDWDLEGNDSLESDYNLFTVECLEKMGHISSMMKQDGYIVGMAPPQSYMNFDNPHFSRYVNLTEPDREWHPEFHYFGANVYSYLLAKYGDSIDFCSMQLYESYSLAAMAVYHQQMAPEDYLVKYIEDLIVRQQSKFYVDFGQDKDVDMQGQYVPLPLSKLVIGLANGWAADPENTKHIFISPSQIQKAYDALQSSQHGDLTPRGFMYWTIEEEGTRDVYLARDLHKILHNS